MDIFAGTLTSGIAAMQLKRRYVGIEKDPLCYKASVERLERMTRDLRATPKLLFSADPLSHDIAFLFFCKLSFKSKFVAFK